MTLQVQKSTSIMQLVMKGKLITVVYVRKEALQAAVDTDHCLALTGPLLGFRILRLPARRHSLCCGYVSRSRDDRGEIRDCRKFW